jgi:hypothetical protein
MLALLLYLCAHHELRHLELTRAAPLQGIDGHGGERCCSGRGTKPVRIGAFGRRETATPSACSIIHTMPGNAVRDVAGRVRP